MGLSATSLTGSGLRDWLVQRVSAVILAAYTFFILYILVCCGPIDYASWRALFSHFTMQIATSVVMFMVLLHAWIGIWTVLGDYVKCWVLRLVLHWVVVLGLLALLVWGLVIVWSV